MDAWKSYLKADPTGWLLQTDDPSLKYFVHRDLLDMPEPELSTYRAAITASPAVERILSRQDQAGYWGKPGDFYERSKYKGTVWSTILLAELGADPTDKRIRKAGDFLLTWSQDPSGGFAHLGSENGGDPAGVIPCLTGNLAWGLLQLGFGRDPRLRRALDWISRMQRFDDRTDDPPRGGIYDRWKNCWGRHTCGMGAIKSLKALAALPVSDRTPADEACITAGVEFFLKHQVYLRSRNPSRPVKDSWITFTFPRMYDTDALEILDVLLSLGCRDARMLPGIELVLSKQCPDGTWLMDRSWNGRMQIRIEKEGEPSRWVTYQAMKVLKRWKDYEDIINRKLPEST